ncbi:hypothetical protein L9F63_005991 [Diploptera punctata]|uniref:Uncharacterized protein n=1 Tax=Diploptera punctata TaxID=6984 RepID=A0AAD8E4Y1_DIPPU|nr:hypothetical protein L9F63_005991 [Diploptera punctata]
MNFPVSTLKQASLASFGQRIAGTLRDLINIGLAKIDGTRGFHLSGNQKRIFLGTERLHIEESIDFFNTVVLPVCNSVETMISRTPWPLANELTEKLMSYILHELYIKMDIQVSNFEEPIIKNERIRLLIHIGIQMFKSIVHQYTTVLEFKKYMQTDGMFDDIWQPELCTKLHRVTVFRNFGTYSRNCCFKKLCTFLKHLKLKEFTFSNCTPELLKAVSKGSAESLLTLNVSFSPYIMDECVATLKKFKNLVSINIQDTALSPNGISSIINNMFAQKSVVDDFQLKSYQGLIGLRDIDIIVNFNKIYRLGLEFGETFEVDKLKHMKYLTHLDINGNSMLYDPDNGRYLYRYNVNVIHFRDIKPILEIIGHQLKEITLRYIRGIRLDVIQNFCPTLQHLGLFTRENYTVCYHRVQGMPSVKSLTLGVPINGLCFQIIKSLNRIVKLEFTEIGLGTLGDSFALVDLVQRKIKSGLLKELVVPDCYLKYVGHWEKNGIRIKRNLLQQTICNMLTEENEIMSKQILKMIKNIRQIIRSGYISS